MEAKPSILKDLMEFLKQLRNPSLSTAEKSTEKDELQLPDILKPTSRHRIRIPVKTTTYDSSSIASQSKKRPFISRIPLLKRLYLWAEKQEMQTLFGNIDIQSWSVESKVFYLMICLASYF
jgi:hypothetical protein